MRRGVVAALGIDPVVTELLGYLPQALSAERSDLVSHAERVKPRDDGPRHEQPHGPDVARGQLGDEHAVADGGDAFGQLSGQSARGAGPTILRFSVFGLCAVAGQHV